MTQRLRFYLAATQQTTEEHSLSTRSFHEPICEQSSFIVYVGFDVGKVIRHVNDNYLRERQTLMTTRSSRTWTISIAMSALLLKSQQIPILGNKVR